MNMEKPFILILANPDSGSMDLSQLEAALERAFEDRACGYRLHRLDRDDDLARLVRKAEAQGCTLVAAAGGDGTVSAAANALEETGIPLGILPLGTGNVLAQELGIPFDLDEAVALLLNEHRLQPIDAMRVAGEIYLLGISAGVTAAAMESAPQESKRRFGVLAYLWAALDHLAGLRMKRFRLEIDGRRIAVRAAEVAVTNTRTAGAQPFQWGEGVAVDDGVIRVCVVRGRTVFDYARTLLDLLVGRTDRSRHIRCFDARRLIRVEADRPLPVQADGEMIGETPLEIEVVPQPLRVVAPLKN